MQRDYHGYNYQNSEAKISFSLIRVLKNKEKEATSNFALLPLSRIIIEWFMKTYIHKPIKILQLLSRGKIQKCFTCINISKTLKYFSIFNNEAPVSWVVHIIIDFLTCCSCFSYSFMFLAIFYKTNHVTD